MFCVFLSTILTIPRLTVHVKHLDVAFIARKRFSTEFTTERAQSDEALHQETSAHDVIAPYWPLFGTKLQELAPQFELYNEERYCVI